MRIPFRERATTDRRLGPYNNPQRLRFESHLPQELKDEARSRVSYYSDRKVNRLFRSLRKTDIDQVINIDPRSRLY